MLLCVFDVLTNGLVYVFSMDHKVRKEDDNEQMLI